MIKQGRRGCGRNKRERTSPFRYRLSYSLTVWMRWRYGEQYGTTLKAGGTSPPAWTLTGTPARPLAIHAEIDSVAGGTALGQATYKWRENETASYTTGVLTAAGPTALGDTGLSVTMAAGPYNIDNTYDLTLAQWSDQALANHASIALSARQPVANLTTGPSFDGIADLTTGDCLQFPNNLTAPTGASFFASVTNTGAPNNRILFQVRERFYYSTASSVANEWMVQMGGALSRSGIALTATRAIAECIDRAPNDVTLGVNGVLVTRTNAVSYNVTASAGISSPDITQQYNGTIREIIYFVKPMGDDPARMVRQGIALRTEVPI